MKTPPSTTASEQHGIDPLPDYKSDPNKTVTRVFLNRNVALLWFGQLISKLGDWCLWIAIPTTIYNTTNSRVDLAFTIFTEALPFLIFAPIAGVIVDRFDRRITMIAADIGRALFVALLFIPRGAVPLAMYYGVLFACSALSAFFSPARIAIMSQLVPTRQLVRVNAALATGMEISELAGPVMGGFVLAELLQRGSFLVDVISFAVSALCIAGLSSAGAPAARKGRLNLRSAIEDMRTGLSVLMTTAVPRGMLIWWNLGYFATAIFIAMLYPIARDVLGANVSHFGIMLAYVGAGLLTAGVGVATVLHRITAPRLIVTGLAMSAISCLGVAWTHSYAGCCAWLFVFGFGGLLVNVTAQSLVQTVVPQNLLGRYFGMFAFLARIAQLVGTAAAGLLASIVSLSVTYSVATAIYLASTIFAYYLLRIPPVVARTESEPIDE